MHDRLVSAVQRGPRSGETNRLALDSQPTTADVAHFGDGRSRAVADVVPTGPPTLFLWTPGCWRGTLATATPRPSAAIHAFSMGCGLSQREMRRSRRGCEPLRGHQGSTVSYHSAAAAPVRFLLYHSAAASAPVRFLGWQRRTPLVTHRCGCASSPPLPPSGSWRDGTRGRHLRSRPRRPLPLCGPDPLWPGTLQPLLPLVHACCLLFCSLPRQGGHCARLSERCVHTQSGGHPPCDRAPRGGRQWGKAVPTSSSPPSLPPRRSPPPWAPSNVDAAPALR